jgi:hypothetical protein
LLQYPLNILKVFFLCVRKDEDVIKVHDKEVVLVEIENILNKVLETSRSIGEAKCHD